MDFWNNDFIGNTVLQWAISLSILLGSFILVKILYWIFSNILKKVTKKTKTTLDDILIEKLEKPITYLVFIIGYWIAIHQLIFTEQILLKLEKVAYIALVFVITSIVSRIVDAIITEIMMPMSDRTESEFDDQLIPVVRKGLRAIIWVVGIIVGLDNIGFDITAMIAGLGVGGLALALAAQDSVKNLFAGIMIFLDKPFKMKERIQIDGFDGIVEEVGLRSTRIRTLDGRLVTILNSSFTDNSVLNVTSQPATKVKLNLGLTYDTDEKGMQRGIDILKEIINDNSEYVTDNYSVGFKDFGDFSLGILFIYYIKPDAHWLDTPSKINMEILQRFNAEGLEFAFPSQTIYKKEI